MNQSLIFWFRSRIYTLDEVTTRADPHDLSRFGRNVRSN